MYHKNDTAWRSTKSPPHKPTSPHPISLHQTLAEHYRKRLLVLQEQGKTLSPEYALVKRNKIYHSKHS